MFTTRLQSLRIKNIKNVENGFITMPNFYNKEVSSKNAEILGLYGQNGSGKTTVVDVMHFLQSLMMGLPLERDFSEYMMFDKYSAGIEAEFYVFQDNKIKFDIIYSIQFSRIDGNKVIIEKEQISAAKYIDDVKGRQNVFIRSENGEYETIFEPKKNLQKLLSAFEDDTVITTDLIVAKKIAEKSKTSYIFNDNFIDVCRRSRKSDFTEYFMIIMCLYDYAHRDLFVIRNDHSGVIFANFVLPMAFRVNGKESSAKGDFAVSLRDATVINSEMLNILNQIVSDINSVLNTIIPNMKLDIKNYGSQLLDNGSDGFRIEVVSVRNDVILPIRMESEGIIKIISILEALICAFGSSSICLVIDELDSGIYEYILGEILVVFAEHAKGQLIFTSHNLRPLEMLDKSNIVFSTANSKERYIRMSNVKQSNNLRNVYLRSVLLGGQNEPLYEETSSLKMAQAFRMAGKRVYGNN